MNGWTAPELEVWATVAIVLGLIAHRGIVWLREQWLEHLATCERCYQRRHPQSSRAADVPESPALRRTPVDTRTREARVSTGPQRRVEVTQPVRASTPRPWAAPSPQTAAHPAAVGSVRWRPAEPTAGASRG